MWHPLTRVSLVALVSLSSLRGKEEFMVAEWWVPAAWCEFVSCEWTPLIVSILSSKQKIQLSVPFEQSPPLGRACWVPHRHRTPFPPLTPPPASLLGRCLRLKCVHSPCDVLSPGCLDGCHLCNSNGENRCRSWSVTKITAWLGGPGPRLRCPAPWSPVPAAL